MDPQSIPLRTTGIRFVRAARTFARSEVGWKAKLIFAALVLLLCASNALNVINSYVGRNFMTAIADRDMTGFVRQAFFYIGVFAALTLVAVIARFGEERLGLLWRDTMTRGILRRYLTDGTYQRLNVSGTIANPAGRKLAEMDLVEINEAFAAQVLACLKVLGWDERDRLNVNGSGISLGHPIGATGVRIMTTLVHEMRRRDLRYGLESMCIGGGQGMAAIFEAA